MFSKIHVFSRAPNTGASKNNQPFFQEQCRPPGWLSLWSLERVWSLGMVGCWVTQLKLDTLIHGQVWFFSMRYVYFNKVTWIFWFMWNFLDTYGSFSMVGFHVCSWGGQLPRCCWASLEAKLRSFLERFSLLCRRMLCTNLGNRTRCLLTNVRHGSWKWEDWGEAFFTLCIVKHLLHGLDVWMFGFPSNSGHWQGGFLKQGILFRTGWALMFGVSGVRIYLYTYLYVLLYIYYIYIILYFNIHNPCAPDSLRNLFVSSRVWRPWPKQAMKVIGSPPPRRTFAFSATLCRSRPTWICGMVRCDFSGTLEVDQKFITADGEMLVQGLRECRCVRAAQLRVLWSWSCSLFSLLFLIIAVVVASRINTTTRFDHHANITDTYCCMIMPAWSVKYLLCQSPWPRNRWRVVSAAWTTTDGNMFGVHYSNSKTHCGMAHTQRGLMPSTQPGHFIISRWHSHPDLFF